MPGATVAELIASVRAAHGRSDAEVAAMVRQTALTERLDDAVIEQLQSDGAGTRTVAELEWLREGSAALPAPTGLLLFDAPAPLSAEDQTRLIVRARVIALDYTESLPNFVCTESVQRHVREKGKEWTSSRPYTMEVSYSPKGETYKLLTFDGKPTRKSLKDVGGFRSDGEFGSTLRDIFRPEAAAKFQWARWANLRGRRVAVLAYHIDRANSHFTVSAATNPFRTHRIQTGMRGEVYLDPESGRSLRIGDGDDGLPSTFPIRSVYAVMDYEFTDIGGREFLLPRRVDMRVTLREHRARNLMEFSAYRKFDADTNVTFEK